MTWLIAVIGLALGALTGRRLAHRGITAATALEGRQHAAYLVLVLAGLGGILVYFSHRVRWIPTPVVLYAEVALLPLTLGLIGFSVGLLVVLEWPGRHDATRRRTMLGSILIFAVAAGFLGYRSLSIIDTLDPGGLVLDGVVMQTSAYTCAPASIATLARAGLADPTMTERRAAALTRTTRSGTHTLVELRVLRRLGLAPRFARGLTVDSLVAHGGPALLHVNEPQDRGGTIRHAVALLAIDTLTRTLTLGNPLHGRQVRTFDGMRGYWFGEALLVTAPTTSGSARD